jgi:3-oxoacyl-[acyl-carrier protein] reductase
LRLTGFCPGLACKTVAHNVTLNAILSGPFDTDRLAATLEGVAKVSGKSLEDITTERQAGNPAGCFGGPAEFGELCAFNCSAQAGYITGQNLLIDGGGYPSTF